MLETPVAFFVFNRPRQTQQVFQAIRAAQPGTLFVVADGPRADVPQDVEKCAATREVIRTGVDWPCEVITDLADHNLGLKKRVASGLNRVFSQTEEAIILEDDCLPDSSFFRFCSEMLNRFRSDPDIMQITGTNLLPERRHNSSFFYSRWGSVWGWATWRRAWQFFDLEMRTWPEYKQSGDLSYFGSRRKMMVERLFDDWRRETSNSWAGPWTLACLARRGLAVVPSRNLVANTGFDEDATHTKAANRSLLCVPSGSIDFPLAAPSRKEPDRGYDRAFVGLLNGQPPMNLPESIKHRLYMLIHGRHAD